jgi:hypothetical protein
MRSNSGRAGAIPHHRLGLDPRDSALESDPRRRDIGPVEWRHRTLELRDHRGSRPIVQLAAGVRGARIEGADGLSQDRVVVSHPDVLAKVAARVETATPISVVMVTARSIELWLVLPVLAQISKGGG